MAMDGYDIELVKDIKSLLIEILKELKEKNRGDTNDKL